MSRPRRTSKAKPRTRAPHRSRSTPPQSKVSEVDPLAFWGTVELLPPPPEPIAASPDPKALIQSLGRVPLAGHETAAEHWLGLVYERAAVLGLALAAAGGLSESELGE